MHFACLWSDKNFNQTENANDVKSRKERNSLQSQLFSTVRLLSVGKVN